MKRKGTPESYAIFSDCEKYRYELGRIWDESKQPLVWIGLNPSTADEFVLDPTLTRIQKRSEDFGAGGFIMLNLFAFRATDPKEMKRAFEPIGRDNDDFIRKWVGHQIVACWGVNGVFQQRGQMVLEMLFQREAQLFHIELTKRGHPKHPLYCGYDKTIQRWR